MRPLLLALPLLLPGCAAPFESAPEDGSCGERFAGPLGDAARLVAALQDEPDAVVARLLAAVDDEARGPPRAEAEALVWDTARGSAAFVRAGANNASATWTPRDGQETDPEALLARVLEAFSAPPEVKRLRGEAWNEFHGAPVSGTGARASSDGVTVGPLYEWAPGATPLPEAALVGKAREVAACLGAEGEGAEHRRLEVVETSLAWTLRVGSCDVRLDAQTGSFIGGTPCEARGA